VDADALDEDDGRSGALDLVREVAAFVEDWPEAGLGSFGNFGMRHGEGLRGLGGDRFQF
jgi:hypothetical protein